jgi:hypothetical protein
MPKYLQVVLEFALLAITIVPLFLLAKRPTRDVCPPRNQEYGLTVSPAEEGVLYVAE